MRHSRAFLLHAQLGHMSALYYYSHTPTLSPVQLNRDGQMPFKWFIRGKLKRAAKLHRKGILNDYQYAYLAIKFGHQLLGRPLNPGTEIDYWRFEKDLAEHLQVSNDPDLQKSFRAYGPWHKATVTLKSDGERYLEARKAKMLYESDPVIRWTGDFENAATISEETTDMGQSLAANLSDVVGKTDEHLPVG